MQSIRRRLTGLFAGEVVERPVYAVYDWFVQNRSYVDWETLFNKGLGQINHASVVRWKHPNFERIETHSEQDGQARTDLRIVTDVGELHEWYLGEWRQEYLIKAKDDYKIMMHALKDVSVTLDDSDFVKSEKTIGDGGITIADTRGGPIGNGRTPLMALQVDWVGLEKWSIDLALEDSAMFELLEVMKAIKIDEIKCVAGSSAVQFKLWENLSIETMGPNYYRKHLLPVYKEILDILNPAGKKLSVHYDGNIGPIIKDIKELDIFGLDSFTEPPEGDTVADEARSLFPDKFFWANPNLGWYGKPEDELKAQIRRLVKALGPTKFCLMISEEVPFCWEKTIPAVLEVLGEFENFS